MDPLSITVSVFSFIGIARRIQESVEKIGENSQTLADLMQDVLEELADFQKLCQNAQVPIDHLDPDSTRSLEKLYSDLMDILECCLKLTERRQATHALSFATNYVIAWVKNAKIEGHIRRLRSRISSIHRRFGYISSLRVEQTEHRLLIASSEHRAILNRLEGSISQLLIDSHVMGTYPASVLDRTSPDGVEYKYLCLQVRRTADLLGRISATHTFTIEETRGAEPIGYRYQSDVSLVRSTTIEVLQTLQLLEFEPCKLALREGFQHLRNLGNQLVRLELTEDAAIIFTRTINIYELLMQRNPSTYLPYVVWGLRSMALIRYGTPEGLDAAKRAVDTCKEVADILQEEYSLHLARSLPVYSFHLVENGHLDDALAYAKEGLAMQRKAPVPQQDSGSLLITWEASGDEHVALSSARTISRAYEMAADDALCLGPYTHVLVCMGRWSEALIIATETVNCLDALVRCQPQSTDLKLWLISVQERRQDIISKICSPGPPLVASISEADDLDHLDLDPGESGTCA